MGVIDASKHFVNGIKALTGKPLVNEPTAYATSLGTSHTTNSPTEYSVLWEYAKRSPEVIIPGHTIISDVISDGYTLQHYDGGSSEKRLKEGDRWLRRNRFNTNITPPLLWDALITGDYYLYTPEVSEDQILAKIDDMVNKFGFYDKRRAANKIYQSFAMDYTFGSLELVPLASETVKIDHDEHQKINKYIQKVGSKRAEFTPDEIIHNKYIPMNGKVYGFTPMKSILAELSILAGTKDILGYSLEKGGVPEWIFVMEEESPKSPNVKNLRHQLRRFKKTTNKMRSLLLTGKIDVKELTPQMKDMPFKEWIETFAKIGMMVWGVPPSKMGMVGEKGSGYDSGLATEGYYKKIANLQMWYYESINWELMIPKFGIEIIPNKSYLQDEVRETQVLMQKVQAAIQMYENGWVNNEYIAEHLLKIPENYRGDFKPKMIARGELSQNLNSNQNVMQNPAQQDVNSQRSKKQKTSEVGDND